MIGYLFLGWGQINWDESISITAPFRSAYTKLTAMVNGPRYGDIQIETNILYNYRSNLFMRVKDHVDTW